MLDLSRLSHHCCVSVESMEIDCILCGVILAEPGGLLFSPPGWPFGMVDKHHLCIGCYQRVMQFIKESRA